MKLLLATTNEGKLRELRRIFDDRDFEILSARQWAADNPDKEVEEVEETGETFAENALLKARAFYELSGLPTIADDSGLQVDALDGAPGIYSARYAGAGASDLDRINKLLAAIREVPDAGRGAQFVCVAALVSKDGEYTFTGTARGNLLYELRGTGGFGYDPVFYYEPLHKTFAELSDDEKAAVSHRGRAFAQLVAHVKKRQEDEEP